MKIRILFSIFALLFLNGLTLADSLPSNPHQMVVINLPKNYPDYSFYMCNFFKTLSINYHNKKLDKTTRIYNEYTFIDFSLTKLVKLSPETPYIQREVLNKGGDYFLIAVKKDVEEKGATALEESIIKLVATQNDAYHRFMVSGGGIYITEINTTMPGVRSPEIVVNEVTDLDKDGLKLREYDGKDLDLSNAQDVDQISNIKQPKVCAGLLMSLGIIFGTIWFFRKKIAH